MIIKEGCEATTDDFWHDLFEGYLLPEKMLERRDDVCQVLNAISILKRFRGACESQITDLYF